MKFTTKHLLGIVGLFACWVYGIRQGYTGDLEACVAVASIMVMGSVIARVTILDKAPDCKGIGSMLLSVVVIYISVPFGVMAREVFLK